ncbi:unnamed protein product [Dimorphilus gyrociliatus]|uniref:Uncharacterized protein n=1 Tax=Dimorphilus gyrociliatus TaxID=2664684 RepID=A0A7I8VX13_9ANNE|nr:unnamed protein product [Dimorphilus gyrociliatus]
MHNPAYEFDGEENMEKKEKKVSKPTEATPIVKRQPPPREQSRDAGMMLYNLSGWVKENKERVLKEQRRKQMLRSKSVKVRIPRQKKKRIRG